MIIALICTGMRSNMNILLISSGLNYFINNIVISSRFDKNVYHDYFYFKHIYNILEISLDILLFVFYCTKFKIDKFNIFFSKNLY